MAQPNPGDAYRVRDTNVGRAPIPGYSSLMILLRWRILDLSSFDASATIDVSGGTRAGPLLAD